MYARLQELATVRSPVEGAVFSALAGFLGASVVVLFNLGASPIQSGIAVVTFAVLFYVLAVASFNAVRGPE